MSLFWEINAYTAFHVFSSALSSLEKAGTFVRLPVQRGTEHMESTANSYWSDEILNIENEPEVIKA